MLEKITMEEAWNMLDAVRESIRWYKNKEITTGDRQIDGATVMSAVTRVEESLSELSTALNEPTPRITASLRVHAWQNPGRFYRWLEKVALCGECRKAAGTNLTMTTEHDGLPVGIGVMTTATPASRISNRAVCDDCLEQLKAVGAQFSRLRPGVLLAAQAWNFKGLPALLMSLTSLVIAIVALVT